ncbi:MULTISPECIES: hypothetical protein [unclassified Rathayibacter]|nr:MULTISPECIES: hypothetical protein [unclassified Rathayibacter]MBF4462480.1 hypothetical protein [Rathayibacter sp. VKM Ac-2879]MBF4503477.1 hypothetical protein [Rathayibacter sp. VKM Ac-2878]
MSASDLARQSSLDGVRIPPLEPVPVAEYGVERDDERAACDLVLRDAES